MGMSDDYVPTPRLRWVERHNDPRGPLIVSHVLQQWWANPEHDSRPMARQSAEGEMVRITFPGEWRDVPVERERG